MVDDRCAGWGRLGSERISEGGGGHKDDMITD